jgi:hypothetical protein
VVVGADRLIAPIVDHVRMQVITASRPEWIVPFVGLQPGQVRELIATVAERRGSMIADDRRGRPWSLPLLDRVQLIATYWRTNLTMRQIGPLFRVSHSAAHRIIDTLQHPRHHRVRNRQPPQHHHHRLIG